MRADLARHLAALLASVLLVLGLSAAPFLAAPAHAEEPRYATLTVTELTPSSVTSAGEDEVKVRGRLTNTFDRPINNLQFRLQRGPLVRTAVALRTSLMAPPSSFAVQTAPQTMDQTLAPGESAEFELTAPVSGPEGLQIDTTGVYPLQITASGVPESGGAVQLAQSRTQLPVVSLPADARRAAEFTGAAGDGSDSRLGRDGSLAPDTSAPAALTMIWPLAAAPQLAPGVLGGGTEPVRLISDQLAASLAPQGRLGAQLEALEKVREGVDSRVAETLCVAVDPDLLVTVHGMTLGYEVSDDPADQTSGSSPGTGQEAATDWLAKLRAIADDLCITALPFAQAGLDSLATIDDAGLSTVAVTGASDIVDALLDVESLRGIAIPAVGTLSEAGRTVLSTHDLQAAVASSSLEPERPDEAGRYRSGPVALQSYEVPISAALGAAGTAPVVPSILPSWQQPTLNDESAVTRRQAAVAALAFPMLTVPDSENGDGPGPLTGRSAFVMPPTYWSPTVDDAMSLLNAADLLLASGTAEPLSLRTLSEQLPAASNAAKLVTPGDVEPLVAQGFPISAADAAMVRSNQGVTGALEGSLVRSPNVTATPQSYLAPLREDALRAIATPQSQTLEQTRAARSMRITAVTTTLDRMKQSVALLDPGGRYTLASERSPLLLIVRNDLALPIRVQMDIEAPDALNVGDVGVQEIPPLGTRQIQIPTRASTSERATVEISMLTSTGVPLSEPISLSIYSNAYGKPLFWITIAAGVALVLLTARRLWHRFRGEPDPADEDRPEPDADSLRLASAPYAERVERAREQPEAPLPPPTSDREDDS
ncbi:DUF6049 family protein [Gordonia alkaliphila]|uniref:DUF6049 family protein n=1 Tax=Gordonia alkaliphila TaxID=1053547 RepID=UPI001FF1EEDA|nr:DUF6049 family protein [Gordonia alkaliphila]MCK0439010.1 DUF6049 family protein [Gordonia alkaliphila]